MGAKTVREPGQAGAGWAQPGVVGWVKGRGAGAGDRLGVKGAGWAGDRWGWDGLRVEAALTPRFAGGWQRRLREGLGAAGAWGVWGPSLGT